MSSPQARAVHKTHRWKLTSLAVRERDPICKRCGKAKSTTAHHWPRTIEELQALGLDPFDPAYSIGACWSCHGKDDGKNSHGIKKPKPNRFMGTVLKR